VSVAQARSHSEPHSRILPSRSLPSSHPNLHMVLQRARPSYNPRGTCPCWAEHPAAPGGTNLLTRQFLSTQKVGGGVTGVLHSQVLSQMYFALANVVGFCSFFFFSHFLTSLRSCNRHAPLIIQEGRARAGQIVQPRQDGLSSDLDSSIAHVNGEKVKVNSTALSLRMFLHKEF
jgi:hypothetical protein